MDGPYSLTGHSTNLGQQLRFFFLFFGHFSRVRRHPSVCKPNEYDVVRVVVSNECQWLAPPTSLANALRMSFPRLVNRLFCQQTQ